MYHPAITQALHQAVDDVAARHPAGPSAPGGAQAAALPPFLLDLLRKAVAGLLQGLLSGLPGLIGLVQAPPPGQGPPAGQGQAVPAGKS